MFYNLTKTRDYLNGLFDGPSTSCSLHMNHHSYRNNNRHTQAETKWTPFSRWHFEMHFRQWKGKISLKISLKFVLKGPINNIPAFIQKIPGAGQVTSHYLNQWWFVYLRIYASLGLNELSRLPGHTGDENNYMLYGKHGICRQTDSHVCNMLRRAGFRWNQKMSGLP